MVSNDGPPAAVWRSARPWHACRGFVLHLRAFRVLAGNSSFAPMLFSFKHAEFLAFGIRDQPDVAGIGVLVTSLARPERAVTLPPAIRIQPEDVHFTGGAVDESQRGLLGS